MLRPAQLYEEQLKKLYTETWYDMSKIYYHGWCSSSDIIIQNNNSETHQFVSVDKKDNVIGYLSYSIDWASKCVYNIAIISLADKPNIVFAKDIKQAIDDIFFKYNLNRIYWLAYADNPAVRGYRNFIKKHGGKECGYQRQAVILLDGKLHDSVEFEILKSEYSK